MTNDSNLSHLIRDGLPARLDAGQAAKLLGIAPHDVPVLIGAGLLKPLGSPAPNAPKYFALVDVLEYAANRDWLNRATRTLAKHWRLKNDAQRARKGGPELSAKVSATGTEKYAKAGEE